MQGYLIPAYHRAYWMGLEAISRTRWQWLEPSVPDLAGPGKVYTNWGVSPDGRAEPNNRFPPENCGASNMSQLANGAGGWADANCQVKLPFICKMIRECASSCLGHWLPHQLDIAIASHGHSSCT